MSELSRDIIQRLPLPEYTTEYGVAYHGDFLELSTQIPDNSISLIMTSPPFALNKKKPYGNVSSERYVEWFSYQFRQ